MATECMTIAEELQKLYERNKRIYARAGVHVVELYDAFFNMVVQWDGMDDQHECCPFCEETLPDHADYCELEIARTLLDKIIGKGE